LKRILVALVLALVVSLSLGSIALADDPDDVSVSWDGSGSVGGSVDTGDALATFDTAGGYICGTYTARETENTSYPYMGVDNFNTHINAYVEDGYIYSDCTRTDSYEGSYGPSGQTSWSYVGVGDGYASMAYRSTTNFAQQRDCCYTYQLPGGHNIDVNAVYYEIDRYAEDGRGNSGEFYAHGTGTATLDCMNAEASGCWSLKLGGGCGCYTDANYNASGAGHVKVTGTGNNSVAFDGMGISSGGGTLKFIADWVSSISIADYSLTAN